MALTKGGQRDGGVRQPGHRNIAHVLNSVHPDADRPCTGLERLPAHLCRSLGGLSADPAALSDGLLRRPGGEDAGLWHPETDGLCRVSLPPVWPRPPGGVDELEV